MVPRIARQVAQLLDWVHDHLLPNGLVVLGNFDAGNPTRAFIDHILEWRLIHRSPDRLRTIFRASRFGDTPVEIRAEETRVQLFALCRKRAQPA